MAKGIKEGAADERTESSLAMRRRITAPRIPRPPKWSEWSKIKSAALWEIVAVSCEYEPNDLRGWKLHASKCPAPDIFLDRLRRAKSLLSVFGGGLDSKTEGNHSDDVMVRLGDFRAWMERDGVSLPQEFPQHEAQKPPLETREEKQLRLRHTIAKYFAEGRKNFIQLVAREEGCNPSYIHRLIGKKNERSS